MAKNSSVVIFLDTQVEHYQQLLKCFGAEAAVHLLAPGEDGIEAITAWTQHYPERAEIHIIAHGQPGILHLGSTKLELSQLEAYGPQLGRWFRTTQDRAALYLYGCQVAAGDAGAEFVAALHRLTGASIAASPRLVGHPELGGDWQLDRVVGKLAPSQLVASGILASYQGVLAAPTNDNFDQAITLTLADLTQTVSSTSTTVEATSQPLETIHDQLVRDNTSLTSLQKQNLNNSIWWKWTAPADVTVAVNTLGSGLNNTVLAVYTAPAGSTPSVGNLQQVAYNDNISSTNLKSQVIFTATAGTTYYFAVDGSVTATGAVTLNLDVVPSLDPNQVFEVTENSPAGTVIGTPTTSEPVTGWSIVASSNPDNDGDGVKAFRIDANTGEIQVNDAGDLDFEAYPQTYDLQVSITSNGLSSTSDVTINLLDGDVPTFTTLSLTPSTIDEGSRITLSGGFSDPDVGDIHTLTVDWGDGKVDVISNDNLSDSDPNGNKTFSNIRHSYQQDGAYTVTVTIEDAAGNTDQVVRSVTVNNVAPTITQGASVNLAVNEDAAGNLTLNATDPGTLDSLTWTILTAPGHGTATVVNSGVPGKTKTIAYTPTANFSGTDSFEVQVSDGNGGVDTIVVNVAVAPQPDSPSNLLLAGNAATINEADSYTLTGSFFDPDAGDSFTVSIDWGDGSTPTQISSTNGDLTTDGKGNYAFQLDHVYAADSGNGSFDISVVVTDSTGRTSSNNTAVTVENLAPSIDQGELLVLTTNEDTAISFTLSASDVADSSFTWQLVGLGPSSGTVSLTAGPSGSSSQIVTYTPDANYFGDLNGFDIQVSDGDGGTSVISVLVNVTPVNDAPTNLVLSPSPTNLNEGSSVTLSGSFDDVDFSTGDLTEAHTVVIDWGDGTQTTLASTDLGVPTGASYTLPAQNHTYVDDGTYTVSVTVTDAHQATVSQSVAIAVANVAPVIAEGDPLGLNTQEDVPLTFSLNASDVGLNDGLTWSILTQPSHGDITILPGTPGQPQQFTYTPDANVSGLDSVVLQVSDGDGGTDTITVNLNVSNQNDLPQVTANAFAITEGESLLITQAMINATDVETFDPVLTFTVTGLDANSSGVFDVFQVAGGVDNFFTLDDIIQGNVTFVDNGDEIAPSFTITVADGNNPVGQTVVNGNVSFTAVNDAPIIVNSSFTVTEGKTITLSSGNLHATDEETDDSTLVYTVTQVTGGTLKVGGVVANTFTQTQLDSGEVSFTHDGTETAPAFTFTVSDGTTSTAGTATGTRTPVNDPPVIGNNSFTVTEGQTTLITSAQISATDPDNATLLFTVTGVTGGSFQVFNTGTQQWVDATSFTSTGISQGRVRFSQDGTETAPTYTLTVSDQVSPVPGTTTGTGTVTLITVNDAPIVTRNTLTISEGGTVILTDTANLLVTDEETTDPSQLVFTVTAVSGGQFELVNNSGVAITSFTQQQVNDGQVQFVHDGNQAAPTYSLTVSDGTGGSVVTSGTVTFTPVNDAPVITANSLTVTEGQTVTLTTANINATDADGDALLFTITNLNASVGVFLVNGQVATSFSLSDVQNGLVQYQHLGSNEAPSYTLEVTDTFVPTPISGTPTINFTPTNDLPVVSLNTITLNEGDTITLTAQANLAATDEETPANALTYTVQSITHGRFIDSQGNTITSFTQQQVNDGLVRFEHDGGELAPTYTLTVSDGSGGSVVTTGTVTFTPVNDNPVLTKNTLTASEGQPVLITTANINATDVESAANALTFYVGEIVNGVFTQTSTITGGQFELVSNPGVAIDSFTRTQIINNQVVFVPSGAEVAPSYAIQVQDPQGGSSFSQATVNFTATNDLPQVVTNQISISEGGVVLLNSDPNALNLVITDEETPAGQINFTVNSVTGGQFEQVDSPGVAITSFTQQQVIDGEIRFVHDGNEAAPTYTLVISDGTGGDVTSTGTVNFTPVNDPPVITVNTLTLSEGDTVILTTANLNATDIETPNDAILQFTITSVVGGQFEFVDTGNLIADANGSVSTFTLLDVITGNVQFVHTDQETVPGYTVQVNDLAASNPQTDTSTATINYTPINDPPTIVTNTLTLNEGQIILLSDSNILASDHETPTAQLVYTVSNVQGGQFELVSQPGVAIFGFSQQQITSGAVRFVQDGTSTQPNYTLTVADPQGLTAVDSSPVINFTPVNDPPSIITNQLTITEGTTVILNQSGQNLVVTDEDTPADQLVFTVVPASLAGGQFELVSNPGVSINTFTLAQVNNGQVQFVQNGTETTPTYTLQLVDGSLPPINSTATVTFTKVNDIPIIGINSLTITEAGTVVLSGADLAATDEESGATALTYSVTTVTNGQFELVGNPGVAITSFTQAQVNAGAVQFVHNAASGEAEPTYTLTVTDAAGGTSAASTATVTFNRVNDLPVIGTNSLTITEAGTVVLAASDLSATDEESPATALTYSVTSVSNGQFELVGNPGVAITSFTQAQVDTGAVQFVHAAASGEAVPSYTLTVTDGEGGISTASTANVTFTPVNDNPVIVTNTLTITEATAVTLTSSQLLATDEESGAANLTYTVDTNTLTGGQFELVSNPGVAIASFTQSQVDGGQIQFVQDGSQTTPAYTLTVDDGTGGTATSTAVVTFNPVDDLPSFQTNALVIAEGTTVVLGNSNLFTADEESTSDQITYTVTSVTNGRFEAVANPGVAITSFTQAQVTAGAIQFVHSGSEAAPTYSLTVTDSGGQTATLAATISFTNVNDAPTFLQNDLVVNEGATVTLTTANLSASDPDSDPLSLVYTLDAVTGGTFYLSGQALNPGDSFTRSDIIFGLVTFTDDGNEVKPEYTITVSDNGTPVGSTTAAAITDLITSNDPPIVQVNTLTIAEGELLALTASNFLATDEESSDSQLIYNVNFNSLQGGAFYNADGDEIISFTQADLDAGNKVFFQQDGSETPPSFTFTVSDPQGGVTTTQTANIAYTPVNDNPVFVNNKLTIQEGQTVTLTTANLKISDADTPLSQITYTITTLTNGSFSLADGTVLNQGDSFTRTQVVLGQVSFTASSDGSTPAYTLTASDGAGGTAVSTAVITFTPINDPPTLAVNSLTLSEGDTVTLSGTTNFQATDEETSNPNLFTYNITNLSGGSFFNIDSETTVTSFTQQQINDGLILFIHDGNEAAPAFTINLSDPNGGVSSIAAVVNFTNLNDAPTLTTNNFAIQEAGTLVLTTSQLSASDVDNPADQLSFTISNLQGGGQFNLDTTGDGIFDATNVTSFTQQDILDGRVEFVDDGDETAPSFDVALSDLAAPLPAVAGNVTFTKVNDPPTNLTLLPSAAVIDEGSSVTLDGSFTDPDSTVHAATIDWGDGTAPVVIGNAAIISGGNGQFTLPSRTHTYADNGDYTITVTVTDATNGGQPLSSVVQTATLTVNDVVPVAVITGGDPTEANSGYVLNIGTPTDPGTDPITQYTVDWGDGTQSVVSNPGDVLHVYKDWGNFNISVSATDDAGLVTTLGTAAATILYPIPDFNADLNADLFWRDTFSSGSNSLWYLDQGNFVQGGVALPDVPLGIDVVAIADFNNDGIDDLLWNSTTGDNYIWTIEPTTFVGYTLPTATSDFNVVGVSDFNNDGNQDIFWRSDVTGANTVWYLDGNLNVIDSKSLFPASLDFNMETVADFNSDGLDDILWRSQSTGQTFVWFVDDTNLTVTTFSDGIGVVSPDYELAGTADFNGDQNVDLVWSNPTTGQSQVWLLDGTTIQQYIALDDNPGFTLEGVTDFNGDNNPDLLWRNGSTGTTEIWTLNGTSVASVIDLPDPPAGWQVVI